MIPNPYWKHYHLGLITPLAAVLILSIFLEKNAFGGKPITSPGVSQDWPQYLGPQRNGTSTETNLNLDWKNQPPQVLWRVPLGNGFSSVAVIDHRLFTMVDRDGQQQVVCLDADTGKEIWSQPCAPSYLDNQQQAQGPRCTPTYDEGQLYCLTANGELACLKAETGQIVWQVDIFRQSGIPREKEAADPAGYTTWYWGMAGSPLIDGNLEVVQPGGDQDNSVVAFEKKSGKLVWSVGNDPAGYGSPIAIDAAGQRQIIALTGQSVLGIDPSSGDLLWRFPWGRKFNCNCATPLWVNNSLFLSSAYDLGCVLLQVRREEDSLKTMEVWRNKNMQNHFTTSIVLNEHVYGSHGDFSAITFRCLDLTSGQKKWATRKLGKATLIAASDHIIALDEQGTLHLIEPNPEGYVEKGTLPELLSPKAWAAPALSNGQLYLRDEKDIICVDLRTDR